MYRKEYRDDYDGHYDEAEIFMCEVYDDDGNTIGFMIEDDVWYWPDETRKEGWV